MAKLKNILFDLDGTLTDPRPGIVRSIQHALSKLERPVPPEDELLWCIGPPLRGSFATLLGSSLPGLIEQAMVYYRERYSTVGFAENQVYPGIEDALSVLRREDYRLYVATAKPTLYARLILEHFGLIRHFDGVYGSELDGRRDDKGELIRFILEREALASSASLMVGDRRQDMLAAKKNGMTAGGVLYGYGSLDELQDAGADCLFRCPAAIVEYLTDSIP